MFLFSWQRLAAGVFAHVLLTFFFFNFLFLRSLSGLPGKLRLFLRCSSGLPGEFRQQLFLQGLSGLPGKPCHQSFSCGARLACPESSVNHPLFGQNERLFLSTLIRKKSTDMARSRRRRRWRVSGRPRRNFSIFLLGCASRFFILL